MFAYGPGHPGTVLEPLVAGGIKTVAEPVPDFRGAGDAQPVAGLLQPDPQLDVFAGAKIVVEPD